MKKEMKEMKYKSKYYRLLTTFWIMMIVGSIFFFRIWGKLDKLDADIKDFKTQKMIQMYIDSGWIPYGTIKSKKHITRNPRLKEKENG